MKTVAEAAASSDGAPITICDVSPPRGGDPGLLSEIADLRADFLSIAYSPGQSARVNPLAVGAYLHREHSRDLTITLATRDMNRIAIQGLLLGASLLELPNVVVLQGDRLRSRDAGLVTEVRDYTPTGLLADIGRMNEGRDFRGLRLRSTSSLCPGATADVARDIDSEVGLAARKAENGARFLLLQPNYDVDRVLDFQERLAARVGSTPLPALFLGVQIPDADGINFGGLPDSALDDLKGGRSGADVAQEYAERLWSIGTRMFYVVPPIFRSGRRDYAQADEVTRFIGALGRE